VLKFPRIIYFIQNALPTREDFAAALPYGANTVFRNAGLVDIESNVEICDGVAGAIPHKYKSVPDGAVVIRDFIARNAGTPVVAAPPSPPSDAGWGKPPIPPTQL
jgi:hypothetical protein